MSIKIIWSYVDKICYKIWGIHCLVINKMYIDDTSNTMYKSSFNLEYVRYRTLELISEMIKENPKLSGSVAELGVFRGDFSAQINRLFPNSQLYLFDTFEGFNESDVKYELNNNYTSTNVFRKVNSFKDTTIAIVMAKMCHPDKCVIKKGYFPESLEGLDEKFIFVSLDCDLYLPTLAGLDYFYPRSLAGGYIMIHDYYAPAHPGIIKAVNDFEKKNGPITKIPIPDRCGTLIINKPRI
ncbi:MAG: macrocin O-methyltransferase [Paludibacter sp.]|nr:macrocin O-methyltransferase [Paludibacter sp.]